MERTQKLLIGLLLLPCLAGCRRNDPSLTHTAEIDELREKKEKLIEKIKAKTDLMTKQLSRAPEGNYLINNFTSENIDCSKEDLEGQLGVSFGKALTRLRDYLDEVEESPDRAGILDIEAAIVVKDMSQAATNVETSLKAPIGLVLQSLSCHLRECFLLCEIYEDFLRSVRGKRQVMVTADGVNPEVANLQLLATLSGLFCDLVEVINVSRKIGSLSQEK